MEKADSMRAHQARRRTGRPPVDLHDPQAEFLGAFASAAVVAVYLTCPISLPTSTASGAEENCRVRAPRLATLFYCIGESLNRQEYRLLKT